MSRTKKTWLPIVIVGVLAALIVILALVGSAFNDDKDNTSLKESAAPAESGEPEETLPPEVQELLDQLQKEKEGGGSGSTKGSGSTTKNTGSSAKSSGSSQAKVSGSTTKNTGSMTKNTGNTGSYGTGTDTQQTEDNGVMGQIKKYGGKLTEGVKDAAGNAIGVAGNAYKSAGELVGTIRDIGSAYNRGDVQGILTSPGSFAGGVKEFFEGVAGINDDADAGK